MLGVSGVFSPGYVDVIDRALDLAPPEETVGGFTTEDGECFWRVEEACAKSYGGCGTEAGEF